MDCYDGMNWVTGMGMGLMSGRHRVRSFPYGIRRINWVSGFLYLFMVFGIITFGLEGLQCLGVSIRQYLWWLGYFSMNIRWYFKQLLDLKSKHYKSNLYIDGTNRQMSRYPSTVSPNPR
jgi:hypothetical protein